MIATILHTQRIVTKTGKLAIKIKIEVDGEITFVYATPEVQSAFEMLVKFCNMRKWKGGVNIEKFIDKLIPVTRKSYNEHEFWAIDWEQIKIVVANKAN